MLYGGIEETSPCSKCTSIDVSGGTFRTLFNQKQYHIPCILNVGGWCDSIMGFSALGISTINHHRTPSDKRASTSGQEDHSICHLSWLTGSTQRCPFRCPFLEDLRYHRISSGHWRIDVTGTNRIESQTFAGIIFREAFGQTDDGVLARLRIYMLLATDSHTRQEETHTISVRRSNPSQSSYRSKVDN
jgi:hypothetical protein